MKPNSETVALVKHFEGLRLKAYRDPVGVWTIGYGTTSNAGIGVTVSAGMEITEADAEAWLIATLEKFGAKILPLMTRSPTANQYGAMLSLAYNIGVGAFSKSTCLKRFNAGDIEGAAEALTWFKKAGGKVLSGLVRRRAAERELFLADDVTEIVTAAPDPERSSPVKSTTLQAIAGGGTAGAVGVVTALSQLDPVAQAIVAVCAVLAAGALAWIARERLRKWAEGDV